MENEKFINKVFRLQCFICISVSVSVLCFTSLLMGNHIRVYGEAPPLYHAILWGTFALISVITTYMYKFAMLDEKRTNQLLKLLSNLQKTNTNEKELIK